MKIQQLRRGGRAAAGGKDGDLGAAGVPHRLFGGEWFVGVRHFELSNRRTEKENGGEPKMTSWNWTV